MGFADQPGTTTNPQVILIVLDRNGTTLPTTLRSGFVEYRVLNVDYDRPTPALQTFLEPLFDPVIPSRWFEIPRAETSIVISRSRAALQAQVLLARRNPRAPRAPRQERRSFQQAPRLPCYRATRHR